MSKAILNCIHSQKQFQVRIGTELVKACELNPDIPIRFGCRNGQCATCAIKVLQGADNLSKPTSREQATLQSKQLESSYRLACQCAIKGNVAIDA